MILAMRHMKFAIGHIFIDGELWTGTCDDHVSEWLAILHS